MVGPNPARVTLRGLLDTCHLLLGYGAKFDRVADHVLSLFSMGGCLHTHPGILISAISNYQPSSGRKRKIG